MPGAKLCTVYIRDRAGNTYATNVSATSTFAAVSGVAREFVATGGKAGKPGPGGLGGTGGGGGEVTTGRGFVMVAPPGQNGPDRANGDTAQQA